AALFAWILGRNRPSFRVSVRRVVLPLGLVLAFTAAFLGYYFWRVTGSPFKLPYQVEVKVHSNVPLLLWQPRMPSQQHIYYSAAMKQIYTVGETARYEV